jgi:CBS domain-containing protein
MIVRDLMQRHFPYVMVDADIDYVARVLKESGLGAVPVVDENLTPIGVVTRSNIERARIPLTTVELGQLPPFLLKNRRDVPFRPNGRVLRDVMSAPAISIPAGAKLSDVEKMMASHRLKRIPVVEGHKLVGMLLRREVLDAIGRPAPGVPPDALHPPKPVLTVAQPEPGYCDVASAEEYRTLVAEHDRHVDEERDEQRRALIEAREQRIKELAAQRLTESLWREMLARSRAAATAGLAESMLIRFPSQLCTDGGRAINAPDPNWPETLRGEPADVYRRWRNELHPRGFRIAAQVIDFPEGLPGDAALFLMWGKKS